MRRSPVKPVVITNVRNVPSESLVATGLDRRLTTYNFQKLTWGWGISLLPLVLRGFILPITDNKKKHFQRKNVTGKINLQKIPSVAVHINLSRIKLDKQFNNFSLQPLDKIVPPAKVMNHSISQMFEINNSSYVGS